MRKYGIITPDLEYVNDVHEGLLRIGAKGYIWFLDFLVNENYFKLGFVTEFNNQNDEIRDKYKELEWEELSQEEKTVILSDYQTLALMIGALLGDKLEVLEWMAWKNVDFFSLMEFHFTDIWISENFYSITNIFEINIAYYCLKIS